MQVLPKKKLGVTEMTQSDITYNNQLTVEIHDEAEPEEQKEPAPKRMKVQEETQII